MGAAAIIIAVALLLLVLILARPIEDWLDAVADHRRAQAASVMHYAGLLMDEDEEAERE